MSLGRSGTGDTKKNNADVDDDNEPGDYHGAKQSRSQQSNAAPVHHKQKRTKIKSITPMRMKRGKSEEPFLPQDGNMTPDGLSDSGDDLLTSHQSKHHRNRKDVEAGGNNTEEEEMSILNRMREKREWNRRRNTDDCQVS